MAPSHLGFFPREKNNRLGLSSLIPDDLYQVRRESGTLSKLSGASFTSYLSAIFGSKQANVALSLSTANTERTKAGEQGPGWRGRGRIQYPCRIHSGGKGNGLELISTGLR